MNQMFKKVSSVCAALVCAASLTVSGTSFVMAAEMDDAVESQLIMVAEGLTDAIIPLSDEEIESYLEGGDEFTVNAMNAWNDVKDSRRAEGNRRNAGGGFRRSVYSYSSC